MSSDRIGIIGGPYLSGPEVEETVNGKQTVFTYHGSYGEMIGVRNLVRANGAQRIVLRPRGDGNWEVQAAYPWGDENAQADAPAQTWELEIDSAQPSCFLSPILRAQFPPYYTEAAIGAVSRLVTQYQSGAFDNESATGPTAEVTALDLAHDLDSKYASGTICQRLFTAVALRQTESFIEFHTVFRRTITAATPLQVTASYVGAGKIWTTAEVEAYEGVPSNYWFTLPDGMQWHKSPPTVQASTNAKTQIAYYYTECVQASGLFYEAYGGAQLLDV